MANISSYLNSIRLAMFGKDIRSSIADGIEAINQESVGTRLKQGILEAQFDSLVINAGNSNAEIVLARTDANNTTYSTIGDRLNNIQKDAIWLNVKSFGAKGDGITDDTVAIRNALNVANAEYHANIFIPNGTYLISDSLTVYSNTYLKLGKKATIRRMDGGHMLLNGSPGGFDTYSNIRIEGGIWDMDYNHTAYDGGGHFTFGKSKDIHIEDVTFLNAHGNHALDMAGITNLTVRDCKFIGLWKNPNGERDYVEAIQISEFTQAGQPVFGGGFDGSPCENVIIENCKFEGNADNAYYGAWATGIGNHSTVEGKRNKNIKINNCYFDKCSFVGIRPFCWENTFISNCTFVGCKEGIHITSVGIGDMSTPFTVHQPNVNITIRDCTFLDTLESSIWSKGKFKKDPVTGTLDSSSIGYAEGINIHNCKFKSTTVTNYSTLYLELTKNINVSGCIFENSYRPLYIISCSNATIDNNISYNSANEFIFTTTTSEVVTTIINKYLKLTNNKSESAGRTGIFVRYTDRFIVSGNILIGSCIEEANVRSCITIANESLNGIVSSNTAKSDLAQYNINVTSTTTKVVLSANLVDRMIDSQV